TRITGIEVNDVLVGVEDLADFALFGVGVGDGLVLFNGLTNEPLLSEKLGQLGIDTGNLGVRPQNLPVHGDGFVVAVVFAIDFSGLFELQNGLFNLATLHIAVTYRIECIAVLRVLLEKFAILHNSSVPLS